MSEFTQILHSLPQDEAQASEALLPLVYQELRRHAVVRMSREALCHTLQPTALVHEAWLRICDTGGRQWQNRAHFFGAAAEAMRRILIEQARKKSRIKRGSGMVHAEFEDAMVAVEAPDDKLLQIDEALTLLKAEDPLKAKVVTLKFYGGYSNQEVAESLGVTERTVERHWAYAKAWLFRMIRKLH